VIFAVISVFWLVVLVPYFLARRGMPADDEGDGDIPFTPRAVTVVRTGESLAHAEAGVAEVSTPFTRSSQLRELKLLDARAAGRRRRVLIFLLLVQSSVAVIAVLDLLAWWSALVPAGVIALFLVIARFTVKAMRAGLDQRADEIRQAGSEETVALSLNAVDSAYEQSVEISAPIAARGSLWEPVPITRPTYVSTPLAPRTVRTIDLATPVTVPVTADPLQDALPFNTDEADEDSREVG
jgi:hypothetical protein